MSRQTQGSFARNFGELVKEKSQSGTGNKYHKFDFKKQNEEKETYVQKGQRYYDFDEGCWKRK